jgi:hypothetical protein
MSKPAVVVPFEADPALVLIRAEGPVLYVGAPVAPGWAAWAARLDALLAASCRSLAEKGRRARRVTITIQYADGRRRRRSLAVPKATAEARELLPAALGLLRLLVAERPGMPSKLSIHLGQVSRVDGRPMRPGKLLRFRRTAARRVVQSAWVRAVAAVALLVGMPYALPLR